MVGFLGFKCREVVNWSITDNGNDGDFVFSTPVLNVKKTGIATFFHLQPSVNYVA